LIGAAGEPATSEPTGPPPPPDTPAGAPGRPQPPRPPRRLRSFLIGSVVAAVLAVFLFVGLGHHSGSGSGSGQSGPVVAVGRAAPNFTLPSLTGGSPVVLDALGKDLHHPVVLNFFASWCVPCQQETPLLATTADAERAAGSDIQFVGVDVLDPTAPAVAFVHKSGLTYPVGADTHADVAAGLYALDGEPNTYFIDSSGVVVGHTLGPVDRSELQRWIHRLGGSAG
jgi:cytochrome c biogenesis protein CcmG/thiol:disulfide interchange protein DsbE